MAAGPNCCARRRDQTSLRLAPVDQGRGGEKRKGKEKREKGRREGEAKSENGL